MARPRRCELHLGRLEAAPRRRQVRRLRRDRHRQPGEVAASRRPRSSARWPTPSCSQNLSVLTRGQHAASHGAAARRTEHLPARSSRSAGASASPRPGQTRGFDWPKDVPIEELIFVPENAQYYAAFGAACTACTSRPRSAAIAGLDALVEFMTNGRKARLGASAGPPLVADDAELDEFRERVRDPAASRRRRSTPGRSVRGVIGLDGGSTSSKAVLIDEAGDDLCQGSTSSRKGNPIADTKELLAQAARRSCTARARRSRCSASAPPATPPTSSRSRCAPT